MPRGQWKQKYLKQYKALQKNIKIATERGYSVPSDISNIPLARGGYKQAFERIKKITLPTIQRRSTIELPVETEGSAPEYITVKGLRGMEYARSLTKQGYTNKQAYELIASRVESAKRFEQDLIRFGGDRPRLSPSEKLEADIKAWESSKLHEELEQLYKDTYESVTGEKPDYVPYIPMSANAKTIMDMLDSTMGDEVVKSSSSEGEDAIYRAVDLINQFPNRELKYRAHKALQNARAENPTGLAEKLSSQSSGATSILQEGAQITYSGESVEKDDRASMWLSDWIDFLGDTDEFEDEDEDL